MRALLTAFSGGEPPCRDCGNCHLPDDPHAASFGPTSLLGFPLMVWLDMALLRGGHAARRQRLHARQTVPTDSTASTWARWVGLFALTVANVAGRCGLTKAFPGPGGAPCLGVIPMAACQATWHEHRSQRSNVGRSPCCFRLAFTFAPFDGAGLTPLGRDTTYCCPLPLMFAGRRRAYLLDGKTSPTFTRIDNPLWFQDSLPEQLVSLHAAPAPSFRCRDHGLSATRDNPCLCVCVHELRCLSCCVSCLTSVSQMLSPRFRFDCRPPPSGYTWSTSACWSSRPGSAATTRWGEQTPRIQIRVPLAVATCHSVGDSPHMRYGLPPMAEADCLLNSMGAGRVG